MQLSIWSISKRVHLRYSLPFPLLKIQSRSESRSADMERPLDQRKRRAAGGMEVSDFVLCPPPQQRPGCNVMCSAGMDEDVDMEHSADPAQPVPNRPKSISSQETAPRHCPESASTVQEYNHEECCTSKPHDSAGKSAEASGDNTFYITLYSEPVSCLCCTVQDIIYTTRVSLNTVYMLLTTHRNQPFSIN